MTTYAKLGLLLAIVLALVGLAGGGVSTYAWTAPAALNINPATDLGGDYRPQVTTDGAGHWVAVWQSDENLGSAIGTDYDILVARSADNGVTWTDPAALNTNAATDSGWDLDPQVTTDEASQWVAVWHSGDSLGGTIGEATDDERNVISGNRGTGVNLVDSSDNTVSGNYIGTNAAGDAALALGGSISGTVTDEATGDPLSDIRVVVYDTSYSQSGSDYTDSLGNYSVGGLPGGNYKVRFQDSGSLPTPTATAMATAPTTITRAATSRPAGTYASEWYDDKGSFNAADLVPVTAGSDTSGIDAALALGGSISGTVTDTSGAPLSHIYVSVYDAPHDWVDYDFTDSAGNYSLGGLRTGGYKVQFSDHSGTDGTYAFEWYDDKADFDSADLVPVAAGSDTSGIDAALALGGAISGTVTDTSGIPLSDIYVIVWDTSHNRGWGYHTGSAGKYRTRGLRPGHYKVEFEDSSGTYAFEWYDDKTDRDSADPVSVTAGSDTSGINAALALGGSISGMVTDEATGDLLSDICVFVYDTSSASYYTRVGLGYTDSGAYSVGGLPSADYKVEFEDCGSPLFHISECYDDKEGLGSADPVSVTAGSDTSGINAALAFGGSISGTVTDETSGDPLSDISVTVYDTSGYWGRSGHTDFSGAYSVGELPPGDYKVRFRDYDVPTTHMSEWYDDKADRDSADPVSVTAGFDTSGINAALALGGSISGMVTDEATGDLLSDICVAVDDISGHWVGLGRTDFSGAYSVGGLPSGDYKVEFEDCGSPIFHLSEWYDDKEDSESADLVAVTQGFDTSGIDAALALGGSISGMVTDEATGYLLSDICVFVYDTSHRQAGFDYIYFYGAYSVGDLPPGDYKVEFGDCGSPTTHLSEWYDDKEDFEVADLVSVAAGADTSGIDAALHCNTVPPLCGDVDCDDDVDAVDALFILQYVVGARQASDQCPPPEGHLYLPAGDVDCDDDVDAVDALFVLQYVVGQRPELCVCPGP